MNEGAEKKSKLEYSTSEGYTSPPATISQKTPSITTSDFPKTTDSEETNVNVIRFQHDVKLPELIPLLAGLLPATGMDLLISLVVIILLYFNKVLITIWSIILFSGFIIVFHYILRPLLERLKAKIDSNKKKDLKI